MDYAKGRTKVFFLAFASFLFARMYRDTLQIFDNRYRRLIFFKGPMRYKDSTYAYVTTRLRIEV